MMFKLERIVNQNAKLKTEAGDNSKTALEYAQQHALTAELTKVFIGVRSEAGRALNILNNQLPIPLIAHLIQIVQGYSLRKSIQ